MMKTLLLWWITSWTISNFHLMAVTGDEGNYLTVNTSSTIQPCRGQWNAFGRGFPGFLVRSRSRLFPLTLFWKANIINLPLSILSLLFALAQLEIQVGRRGETGKEREIINQFRITELLARHRLMCFIHSIFLSDISLLLCVVANKHMVKLTPLRYALRESFSYNFFRCLLFTMSYREKISTFHFLLVTTLCQLRLIFSFFFI